MIYLPSAFIGHPKDAALVKTVVSLHVIIGALYHSCELVGLLYIYINGNYVLKFEIVCIIKIQATWPVYSSYQFCDVYLGSRACFGLQIVTAEVQLVQKLF